MSITVWEMPMTPQLTSKEYIDALKAENNRLREALESIVNCGDRPAVAIARAALAKEGQ